MVQQPIHTNRMITLATKPQDSVYLRYVVILLVAILVAILIGIITPLFAAKKT